MGWGLAKGVGRLGGGWYEGCYSSVGEVKGEKGGVAAVIRALHVLEKLVESIGKWGVVGEGQWGRRIGSWCVK